MFDVKPNKAFIRDLHKIESNLFVLFNDGENDIIYSGTNYYNNRILGVIMFEDDESGVVRYMHILLSDKQYIDYLNKIISLRQILEVNNSVFIVDKGYNGTEKSVNIVSIEDIPQDYLPLTDSFCPPFIKDPSFSYAVGLKGGKADLNLTDPEDLNSVNTHISDFLKSATEFVYDLNMNRRVYVEALPTGSFRIKFKIEVLPSSQATLFNIPIQEISDFLNEYIIYIFEKLPKEIGDTFKSENIISDNFSKIGKLYTELYRFSDPSPESGFEQKLIDNMAYSIENLKEIEYTNSFKSIEIINYSNTGSEFPLAQIDEMFIPSIENKFYELESLNLEKVIDYDASPADYQIQVYQLNKETGKGHAYLQINEGIIKILLHLKGRTDYQNTDFTHNMDEKIPKMMHIKGIAKRVDGIVKIITYSFE